MFPFKSKIRYNALWNSSEVPKVFPIQNKSLRFLSKLLPSDSNLMNCSLRCEFWQWPNHTRWLFENETAPISATSKYLRKNSRTRLAPPKFHLQWGSNDKSLAGWLAYILVFYWSNKKKSNGRISGEWRGHSIASLLPMSWKRLVQILMNPCSIMDWRNILLKY